MPPFQAWALDPGRRRRRVDAPLAANASPFNLGNAAGPWAGSWLLGGGTAVNVLGYVGAGIVLLSLVGAVVALRKR
ncbi:hypothetical protein ACIRVF_24505 [Kitasatospora sp. NPDC101157]|uniref:hypothetical protein n=1 Tax=Kitasatospora sp. NPDC101157 TaxID=3364098 RepID=UPI0038263FF3